MNTKSDDLHKKALNVIKQVAYINLATITPEGLPWNSPVYTGYDKNLNFYWVSWSKNQHSINIKENPNTFATIYDSSVPAGEGLGIYFQGKSRELSIEKDMFLGLKLLYTRQDKKVKAIKHFMKSFPRRVYKFTPEKVWVNGRSDVKGDSIDVRNELELKTLKELL